MITQRYDVFTMGIKNIKIINEKKKTNKAKQESLTESIICDFINSVRQK